MDVIEKISVWLVIQDRPESKRELIQDVLLLLQLLAVAALFLAGQSYVPGVHSLAPSLQAVHGGL